MTGKHSKQLGALLNRVPSATASNPHVEMPRPTLVPSAPEPSPPPAAAEPSKPVSAPAVEDKEVPLQVLVPLHIRIQLDRRHAESRKSLRVLTLEAFRAIGIEVSDEDIAGKRGRKKS